MSPLKSILATCRAQSQTEREKGSYIITTTNDWSDNAENSLHSQTPPVYKIDLHDLETRQIDWAKYQPTVAPVLTPKKELQKHRTSAAHAFPGRPQPLR